MTNLNEERHHAHDVITLRAKLEDADAEITRLRTVLTSTPALEALMAPPAPVHVIDPERDLTSREFETLGHLMSGCSNDTIARKMFVSTSTTKIHVAHVFRKLHVHNRAGAAAAGVRLGVKLLDM
jgi:DNA-binding NarL/FixJ family response regulator